MKYIRVVGHPTSVKKISLLKEPTAEKFGVADADAQPVFSVFDIGRTAPSFPLNNSAIVVMAAFNFGILKMRGINSHCIGLVNEHGKVISVEDCLNGKYPPSTILRIKYLNRINPVFIEGHGWDYSMFRSPAFRHYVYPIEFISRNELPPESSVWKDVKKGFFTFADLGLPNDFEIGDKVPSELQPILTYSTKYEPDDRTLTPKQAQELMGVSDEEFTRVNQVTREASILMTDYASSRGFERLDGKVEQSPQFLVDAVCTWHEDRLVHKGTGMGISKQRIRNKIKKTNPEWCAEIDRAKDAAKEKGVDDFRKLMDPNIKYVSPPPEFFMAFNTLTEAGTNQWIGRKIYPVYTDKDESLEDNLCRAVEDFQKVK